MYTREITNATKAYGPSNGTSKIGLMYASDYGFAASPSAWTTTLYNYSDNDANGTSIQTINCGDWILDMNDKLKQTARTPNAVSGGHVQSVNFLPELAQAAGRIGYEVSPFL